MQSELDPSLFNERVLSEVAHLWPDGKRVRLRWDKFRERFVASDHQATYKFLYGDWPLLREWHSPRFVLGRLRRILSPNRWNAPLEFQVTLPRDAVVWGGQNIMFVASAQAGRFLKIARGRWFRRQVLGEVEAWGIATQAGMTDHVPRLIDHGDASEEICWISTQLVPNRPSLFFQNADRLWLRRLRNDILPAMQSYYQRSGTEVLSGVEWLEELKKEVMALPVQEPLWSLVETVAKSLPSNHEIRIVRAMVHGDLKPSNAHFYWGQWWLVDWTADSRMAVIWDVFGNEFLAHYKLGLAGDGKRFWDWLRGDGGTSVIPGALEDYVRLWRNWQQSWLGVQITPEVMRFQILAMCLEWYLRMRVAWGASDDRFWELLGIQSCRRNDRIADHYHAGSWSRELK